MTALDDLLGYIFDGAKPALYAEFESWARESRRFHTFATHYRAKIRSKLKNVSGDSGLKDLRAELETAALLLRDERFSVEYEKYVALKQRGPDFTVIFKTHTPFNIEVRRIRSRELDTEETDAHSGRLMAMLGDKVGQMPPSIVNLLWLVAERELAEADLSRAVVALRQLAEHKDEDFFRRRGYKNAADFLKHFRQLSGIAVRQPGAPVLWLNTLARHKTPPDIVTAIQRLLTA